MIYVAVDTGPRVSQLAALKWNDVIAIDRGWLRSVVQGYLNYYAVPGNLESLALFRDRLLGLWWRTLRRRSQQRHFPWTRMLALGRRWFPPLCGCSIPIPQFASPPVI